MNLTRNFKMVVSNPCNESWDTMLPTEQGRFCDACTKEVIDFTGMPDEEILAYFSTRTQQSVCGRFYQTQIDRIRIEIPEYLLLAHMPYWKKFIILFMICFGLQVFNVECYLSGSNQLHAQTIRHNQPVSSKSKKKENFKPSISLNETQFPFTIDQTITISGATRMEPEEPLPTFIQDYSIPGFNEKQLNLKNEDLMVQNSTSPKPNPPSKDPVQNSAALLPTVLLKTRRRRRNDR